MNAAEYAGRRAAGLCTTKGCRATSTCGTLCEKHREQHRRYSSNSQKKLYMARKLKGDCVDCGATMPDDATSVQCRACADKGVLRSRKLRNNDKYRAHRRKMERKLRNKRIEMGFCVACNEPLVTRLYCETHRRKMIQDWQTKHGPPKGTYRCRQCGGGGHYASTCTIRSSTMSGDATVEHYATSSPGAGWQQEI